MRVLASRAHGDEPHHLALAARQPEIKRQTFEAFGLRIDNDKAHSTIALSATITEGVAAAFANTKGLSQEAPKGADGVTVSDIAEARFVSGGDARILERLPVDAPLRQV